MPRECVEVAAEVPAPSPELVLLRAWIETDLATVSRKKGERRLRLVAEKLADEQNLSAVLHIRPSSQRGAMRVARAQATELFHRWLPVLIANLPPT